MLDPPGNNIFTQFHQVHEIAHIAITIINTWTYVLLSVPSPNSRPSDLNVGSLLAPFDLLPYLGKYSFFDSDEDEDDVKVMDIGSGDWTTSHMEVKV